VVRRIRYSICGVGGNIIGGSIEGGSTVGGSTEGGNIVGGSIVGGSIVGGNIVGETTNAGRVEESASTATATGTGTVDGTGACGGDGAGGGGVAAATSAAAATIVAAATSTPPRYLLQYCGRRDQQIKVRGKRVELGEVEAEVHKAIAFVLVQKVALAGDGTTGTGGGDGTAGTGGGDVAAVPVDTPAAVTVEATPAPVPVDTPAAVAVVFTKVGNGEAGERQLLVAVVSPPENVLGALERQALAEAEAEAEAGAGTEAEAEAGAEVEAGAEDHEPYQLPVLGRTELVQSLCYALQWGMRRNLPPHMVPHAVLVLR
jgi:hypothetical protein